MDMTSLLHGDIYPRLSDAELWPGVQFRGSSSHRKALCPVHRESTPSFFLSGYRAKCFGCGWSGDPVDLMVKLRGGSPREAVQHFARQAGVKLPDWTPQQEEEDKLARQIARARWIIASVCTDLLHDDGYSEADTARAECRRRSWPRETWRLMHLGYMPDGHDLRRMVGAHLAGLPDPGGITVEWMVSQGMLPPASRSIASGSDLSPVVTDDGELSATEQRYPWEMGRRLVGAWMDRCSNIVTMWGRSLPGVYLSWRPSDRYPGGNGRPKFYYTAGASKSFPYSPVPLRAGCDHIILVEGIPDAIAGAVRGLPVVALGGADITDGQLEWLIGMRASRVTVCLDRDTAGTRGTATILGKLLSASPLAGRVFVAQNAHWDGEDSDRTGKADLDTALRGIDPNDFARMIAFIAATFDYGVPASRWLFDHRITTGHNLATEIGKSESRNAVFLGGWLAKLPAIERDSLVSVATSNVPILGYEQLDGQKPVCYSDIFGTSRKPILDSIKESRAVASSSNAGTPPAKVHLPTDPLGRRTILLMMPMDEGMIRDTIVTTLLEVAPGEIFRHDGELKWVSKPSNGTFRGALNTFKPTTLISYVTSRISILQTRIVEGECLPPAPWTMNEAFARIMLESTGGPGDCLIKFQQIKKVYKHPVFTGSEWIFGGYVPSIQSYVFSDFDAALPTPAEVIYTQLEESIDYFRSELWVDFPFAPGPWSFAHCMAMMITLAVRPMITGPTPAWLICASDHRVGKTLLLDTILVPFGVIGQMRAEVRATPDYQQFLNGLTSTVRQAPPVMRLDNLGNSLNSGDLASFLTDTSWVTRKFGTQENLVIERDPIFVITAKQGHTLLSDELLRRMLPIELRPNQANPEARTDFRHARLLEWAAENRATLFSHLMRIVQWWVQLRSTKEDLQSSARFGGFEEWVDLVGGILETVGIPGLRGDDMIDRSDNPAMDEWVFFLSEWSSEMFPRTAEQLAELADKLKLFQSHPRFNPKKCENRSTGIGYVMREKLDSVIEIVTSTGEKKQVRPIRQLRAGRRLYSLEVVHESTSPGGGSGGISQGTNESQGKATEFSNKNENIPF